MAIITLLLVACSSGSSDLASVAQVSNPEPTATAIPTETTTNPGAAAEDTTSSETAATTDPTAVPGTTPVSPGEAPEPEVSQTSLQNLDMEAVLVEVRNSPNLLACLTEIMEVSALMEIVSGEPTEEDLELIVPCFGDGSVESFAARFAKGSSTTESTASVSTTVQQKSAGMTLDTPITTVQTALTRPEGVPWYDGPLFDSHIHMTGVTVVFVDGAWTTSDVLDLMDRHNIVGGVAFWLPPLFGRQSEIDLLVNSIGEVDDRLATLMMPPVLDMGFTVSFMGFAEGTYTRNLLEPWYPPNGPFDGFGEVAFYFDKLQKVKPGDSQFEDVFPLVAESGGVVMSHTDASHTAADWIAVMNQYPEITFLFHGLKDFHGSGPDERAAILEMLDTYEGDNLFYSIDAGPLMHAPDLGDGSSVGMDTGDGEVLTSLVDEFGRQKLAEHVYSEYSKEVIEHPDRLMFGTDFLAKWHFEDAASDVIIDFARRFIGLLPEEIQEDFAYRNGIKAFGKYLN